MININKDKLLKLMLSKDEENRKLGISFLINNSNLPKILYYVYNDYGYYYTYVYPKNEMVSFSLNKKKYLNWLEDQFTIDRQKRALLSIIFKYNELYG